MIFLVGCRTPRSDPAAANPKALLRPTSYAVSNAGQSQVETAETRALVETQGDGTLAELVAQALAANPQLRRMEAETAAAWQRVPQARSLPDPMIEGTGFIEPQFMADGEMWATLMVSQAIPYIKQLDARGQEAAVEALMLRQEVQSTKLRIAADVEEAWYRLYLLGHLLRINEANRQLITPLVEVATGRVEVGETTPGDVVLGTLELSRTEEERLMLEQQLASRKAALNQLLNRPADAPVVVPNVVADPPFWQSLDELRAVAFQRQPEIVAARLRTEATAWGIRVARLERIPEVTVLYERMFMEMNPGEDGSDPWRVGLGANIPLWRGKYRAMEREAREENLAAHQGVEEAIREVDSMLVDLLAQARAAEQTARLYRDTILPQARQALEFDQPAYGQGTVTFERVIGDVRNLLTAESAFHRSMADRSIAVARLKQAAGGQLPSPIEELIIPAPPPLSPG